MVSASGMVRWTRTRWRVRRVRSSFRRIAAGAGRRGSDIPSSSLVGAGRGERVSAGCDGVTGARRSGVPEGWVWTIRIVEVEASFPAGGEALELMEQGERLLDDVAELVEAADVGLTSAGDDGQDPTPGQLAADVPAVVTLVAQSRLGPLARPARSAGDRWDSVDQGEGLGDVGRSRRS
ncbi:hypothetical protein GCM10020229_51870 [Kitasatospora albolonga]